MNCCSTNTISFHHLSGDQIKMMEFMVYNLRYVKYIIRLNIFNQYSIKSGQDEDLNPPIIDAILPHRIVGHPNVLQLFINIRNMTLRNAILNMSELDLTRASEILNASKIFNKTLLRPGDKVALPLDLILGKQQVYTIHEVSGQIQ